MAKDRKDTKEGRQKVGFDLFDSEMETVRNIAKRKKIKLVDFFRDAVNDKIEKENKYITIYLFHNMSIKELVLRGELYVTKFRNASEEMKKNVGAEQEGTISLKDNFREIIESHIQRDEKGSVVSIVSSDDELFEDIFNQVGGEVPFFTKERY